MVTEQYFPIVLFVMLYQEALIKYSYWVDGVHPKVWSSPLTIQVKEID